MKKVKLTLLSIISLLVLFPTAVSATNFVSEGFMYLYANTWKQFHNKTLYYTDTYTEMRSGNIKFNSGSYENLFRKKVPIRGDRHWIEAWGVRAPTLTPFKMSITVYDPNGGIVDSKSVGTNQRLSVFSNQISRNGDYNVDFHVNSKNTWNLVVRHYHYEGNKSCKPIGPCQGTQNVNKTDALNNNTSNEYKNIDLIGDHILFIPSDHHKNKNVYKESFTFKELMLLTYDDNIDQYVYDFPGFAIGDYITFKDEILDVKYNEDLNATEFFFEAIEGIESYLFSGDLVWKYKPGDEITLKFEIIPYIEGTKYETLDYISDYINNDYNPVPINKYIN